MTVDFNHGFSNTHHGLNFMPCVMNFSKDYAQIILLQTSNIVYLQHFISLWAIILLFIISFEVCKRKGLNYFVLPIIIICKHTFIQYILS